MVERIAPASKSRPLTRGDDGKSISLADANKFYGKPFHAFKAYPETSVTFREKVQSGCTVRRYFAGSFQIAYVREDGDGFTLWNCGPDPARGLHFKNESDLHDEIARMLMA